MTEAGQFILSFDFELGWGVVESGTWRERENAGVYEQLREVIYRLLARMDRLAIPVTWAAVGGMVAGRSDGEFDHLPPDLREKYLAFVAEAQDPTVKAHDLFDMILGADAPHQIASHSYSHARFSYPAYSLDGKTRDVALSKRAIERIAGPIDAFVYPINHSTDFEPLAANGFRVARVSPKEPRFAKVRPLNKAYYRTVAPPPMVTVEMDETGIEKHFGSMLFLWPDGRFSELRKTFVISRAHQGLRRAARTGGTFHTWLHPFDLANTPGAEDALLGLLEAVARERDIGRVEIGRL